MEPLQYIAIPIPFTPWMFELERLAGNSASGLLKVAFTIGPVSRLRVTIFVTPMVTLKPAAKVFLESIQSFIENSLADVR